MRAQIRGVGAVGAERFDVDGQVLEVLQPRSSRHDFSQPEAEELELRHVRMVRPEPVPADEMDHSSPGWARVGKLGQAQPVNLLECLLGWPRSSGLLRSSRRAARQRALLSCEGASSKPMHSRNGGSHAIEKRSQDGGTRSTNPIQRDTHFAAMAWSHARSGTSFSECFTPLHGFSPPLPLSFFSSPAPMSATFSSRAF